MKTRFKHVYFERIGATDWCCQKKKTHRRLGRMDYYPVEKQYGFVPEPLNAFSHDCLTDIAEFLRELNAQKGEGE